ALDGGPHRGPGLLGRTLARGVLHPLDLVRELVILDAVAYPPRVVASAEVIHPRGVIDAVAELHEAGQVLRFQVQLSIRTTEPEAAVVEIAMGVLAQVTLAFRIRSDGAHAPWFAARSAPPYQGFAGLERCGFHRRRRLTHAHRELRYGFRRRRTHGQRDVHPLQQDLCDVLGVHGDEPHIGP